MRRKPGRVEKPKQRRAAASAAAAWLTTIPNRSKPQPGDAEPAVQARRDSCSLHSLPGFWLFVVRTRHAAALTRTASFGMKASSSAARPPGSHASPWGCDLAHDIF